jgi:hypothetical protein
MQNVNVLYIKSFLLFYVLIFFCLPIAAQNSSTKSKKDDGTISFRGYDAWVQNHFYVQIYFNNNSAKVIYAYRDSICYADVRKDPRHISMTLEKLKYAVNVPLPRYLIDSSLKIFEDHASYTKDSITINLKENIVFGSLMKRFCKLSTEEINPKVERDWMDGYTVNVQISSEGKSLEVRTDTPRLETHPFVIQMISATLGRCESCDAVKKISKYYVSLR